VPVVNGFRQYAVRPGDTLSTIAARFDVSMAAIQRANNFGESQVVRTEQTLKIPLGKTFSDENVYWIIVVVKAGETLSEICLRHGAGLDDAVRVNQLNNASDIRAGDELIMPVRLPGAASTFIEQPPEPGAVAARSIRSAGARAAEITPIVPVISSASASASASATPTAIPEIVELEVVVPTPEPVPALSTSNDSGAIETMRMQLLALYNAARAEAGVHPLAASSTLQQAAQAHAADCQQRGHCSHTGSDGANTQTRVARAGFVGRVWGENWAWAISAQRAFAMWFTEEYPDGPHRRNILSARYDAVGFGIVPSQGGYYFIADFGAP
jgi:uncharacterized protein YkwD